MSIHTCVGHGDGSRIALDVCGTEQGTLYLNHRLVLLRLAVVHLLQDGFRSTFRKLGLLDSSLAQC